MGESAVIDSYDDDWVSEKLMELGCIPGSAIRLIKTAPFGDPLIFQIQNSMIAVRNNEAYHVIITHTVET